MTKNLTKYPGDIWDEGLGWAAPADCLEHWKSLAREVDACNGLRARVVEASNRLDEMCCCEVGEPEYESEPCSYCEIANILDGSG